MTKIAQHNSPIAQPEGSSRNSGDVEKLIERLNGYNITGTAGILLDAAAAMLRSQQAKMDAIMAERATVQGINNAQEKEIASLRAKLESAEDMLRESDKLAAETNAKLKRARKTLEGTLEALDQGYAAADNESFDEICAVIDAARKRARATIEELK